MSKDTTKAACKVCRREGRKLFLKGDRCHGTKCASVKRNYPPGQHGPNARGRLTPFGIQLREKQKAKRLYGLMEKQFRNYFDAAMERKGDTGEIFMSFLERRLDNVAFRMGFAQSRKHARQLVSHGHFLINGKKVDIPSYRMKAGEEIAVSDKSKELPFFKEAMSSDARENTPTWLSSDRKALAGKVLSLPRPDDLDSSEFDIKSIVEYYSK